MPTKLMAKIVGTDLSVPVNSIVFKRSHVINMCIIIALMLSALVTVGYSQDQGKDESLDATLKEFQQAVEKNPNYTEAHYNLGIVYNEKGMVAINPQCADAYYNNGVPTQRRINLTRLLNPYKKP
ncbi:MAG: tetratricopeptide repeat protein [Planctomycetes bacterium]|nr:tetratricopeptide repeat protein [Planctomycetota bacterium]